MKTIALMLWRVLCRHPRHFVLVFGAISLIFSVYSLQQLQSHENVPSGKQRKDIRGALYVRKLSEIRASANKPFLPSDKENQLWWKSRNANASNASGKMFEDYIVAPALMLEPNQNDYVDYSVGRKSLYTYDHEDEPDYPEEISMEAMNRSLFIRQTAKHRSEERRTYHQVRRAERKISKYKHNLYIQAISNDLGTQMFQYAALYGLSRLNRRLPVASGNFSIWEIFRGSTLIRGGDISSNVTRLMEKAPGVYTDSFTMLPDEPLHLCCYFQSFMYWGEYKRSVARQFRFQTTIVETAHSILQGYGAQQLAYNAMLDEDKLEAMYGRYPPSRTTQFTYVAVHVYVADLQTASQRERGYKVAPVSYIQRAMDFFRKEYKNTLLLIFSSAEDTAWCKANIETADDVRFAEQRSPALDLATMGQCNHTVITVGPLSWWAGWLNKGRTVYYSNWTEPGSVVDAAYNSQDYFSADWIDMGD